MLTALSPALQTATSTGAGVAAESMGWAPYFAATTAAALPGLALLLWLGRRDSLGLDV